MTPTTRPGGKRSRARVILATLATLVVAPTVVSAAGDQAFGWSLTSHLPGPLAAVAASLGGNDKPNDQTQVADPRFQTPITDDSGAVDGQTPTGAGTGPSAPALPAAKWPHAAKTDAGANATAAAPPDVSVPTDVPNALTSPTAAATTTAQAPTSDTSEEPTSQPTSSKTSTSAPNGGGGRHGHKPSGGGTKTQGPSPSASPTTGPSTSSSPTPSDGASSTAPPVTDPPPPPAAVLSMGLGDLDLNIDAAGLAPGDLVVAPLVIQNTGTVDFTYSMTATMDGLLGHALHIEARAGVTTCDPQHYTDDGIDLLPDGPLDGSSFGLGTDTRHTDARTVSVGYQTTLCVALRLPQQTDNEVQGATGSMVLDFTATQA